MNSHCHDFRTSENYFDHAATSPLDPRVLEEMLPYFNIEFGNPNSPHSFGKRAMKAVDAARLQVSEAIGAEDPSQIVFTSGSTEANNWVLHKTATVYCSPYEHSSVREVVLALAKNSTAGTKVVESDGNFSCKVENCDPDTLFSIMAANNETGTIFNPVRFKEHFKWVHTDITQVAAKIKFSLDGLDYASCSAHKFYGPKGIGALYSQDYFPDPFLIGGGQESGHRSGTLNVPGIVGMGLAAKIAQEEQEEYLNHSNLLRNCFLEEMKDVPDFFVNGGPNTVPSILSVSYLGTHAEPIVIGADLHGFAISSGAACSSNKNEPSPVLQAMNYSPDRIKGALRISFGRGNTEESTINLAKTIKAQVKHLRGLS